MKKFIVAICLFSLYSISFGEQHTINPPPNPPVSINPTGIQPPTSTSSVPDAGITPAVKAKSPTNFNNPTGILPPISITNTQDTVGIVPPTTVTPKPIPPAKKTFP